MTITTTPSPPPPPPPPSHGPPPPPTINVILSFLLVGLAWGFTVPFIRRAARDHRPRDRRPSSSEEEEDGKRNLSGTWWARLKTRVCGAAYAVLDLLRNPRYAVPLVLNLTGSVWFFLLIGQAELSLTVPVVNTLAFLFTVLGEWWVEGKVISRETLMGMFLSVGGIALCVHSKNTT
ncbi:uncharacterized protein B0T15DRAFT_87172 [Chaetomium strumarium]|uniref:Integral membrane protein n=1 Tax=Chaetomium strumarium TaxID=1170767 RepID=A0AAJ0GXA4_9PEZI|nr:hypothetical protein B0T15DRAFT_87172 [Chaetomium strumarium]